MTQPTAERSEPVTGKETGAVLLAFGGLAAAFGAASCCALPMLLGGFGGSSAWLFGLAVLSAPHRISLIITTVLCLVGAGLLLALRARAIACLPGAVCGHVRAAPLVIGLSIIGAALALAGYLYA